MANQQRGERLLISALARGLTQKNAAAEAGVSERTVRRRMADPEFRMRVIEEGEAIAGDANAALIAKMPDAVATLGDVMDHGKPEVRLRAAMAILEAGDKARARLEVRGDHLLMWLLKLRDGAERQVDNPNPAPEPRTGDQRETGQNRPEPDTRGPTP